MFIPKPSVRILTARGADAGLTWRIGRSWRGKGAIASGRRPLQPHAEIAVAAVAGERASDKESQRWDFFPPGARLCEC